jgi:hypothetical protein
MMSMISFITVAAGILATIGLGGILLAAAAKDPERSGRCFKVGMNALCLGGLVLLVGSVAGWSGADAMFGGLLMVLFGADAKFLPANQRKPAVPHESAD